MKPFGTNQNVSNVKSNGAQNMAKRKTVVFKQQSMKYTESMNESGFQYTNEQSAVSNADESALKPDQSFNNCIGAGIGGFMEAKDAIQEFEADESQIKVMDGLDETMLEQESI